MILLYWLGCGYFIVFVDSWEDIHSFSRIVSLELEQSYHYSTNASEVTLKVDGNIVLHDYQ